MVSGSLLGAVAAYLFQVVVGRALGDEAFAPIGAMWTTMFIIATVVLVPLEQFATREASRDRHVIRSDARVGLVLIGVAALAGAAFVGATLDRFFAGEPIYVVQMALLMTTYGVLYLGRGVLAGHRRFKAVGLVLASESLLRLVLAAAAVGLGWGAVGAGWAMVIGGLAVFGFSFWRSPERTSPERSDRPFRFLGAYASGSTASQLLLAASPLAVGFLGGSPGLFSVVFVTFTLFRAPLTLIYSLQGRLLSMLVRLVDGGRRSRIRAISAAFAGAGVALSLLGWQVGRLVGADVVSLLFGPAFAPTPDVAGLVAAGMVAASVAQITGQVLVAEGRTGRLASAWVAGLAVALLMLLTGGDDPALVVARAFALGEAAALATVGLIVLRSHRPPRS